MIKFSTIFLYFYLLPSAHSQAQQECLSRDYGRSGTVCVCNSEHCDTIPKPDKIEPPQYLKYTSNKAGLRLKQSIGHFEPSNISENQIHINRGKKFQKILGWGGAFTDAVGINIDSLTETLQEKLLRSYFADDGIEYSMCRVPLGATDFSTREYTYDDGDIDIELERFALAEEDYKFKIPYIKEALKLSQGNLELIASSWMAPKWMKTNGQYGGLGFLKKEMYQVWADYFVKFLDHYKKEGIPFWGITTGNEPNTVFIPFNSINTVGWITCDLAKWVSDHLGPSIKNSSHSNAKIIILDDQRLHLPIYVDRTLASNTTRQYVDGIAVHSYTNLIAPPSVLTTTHNHFPDKFLLSTEACNGFVPGAGAVLLGSWERGELYSIDIIENVQNWVSGWIDWNMVLNVNGGPTYIDNFVDAPIIVNTTAGEFYKQPMFYHMGHFSKFVPKNSMKIETKSTFIYRVMVVAFERPDNGTAVILLNRNKEVITISLTDESRGTAQLDLSAKSITTILYW